MMVNPLTYGMQALLATMFPGSGPAPVLPVWTSILVLAAFAFVVFMAGFIVANQRRTVPAA
jgi:ABC-type polysaccharide/polyol phosphate export permease